jgi:hypothetical protein
VTANFGAIVFKRIFQTAVFTTAALLAAALLSPRSGAAPAANHWAFKAPVKAAPPKVKDAAWPRNAIDQFVLAKLEAEGLRPSAEADRYTLIRRVYLDLIGLPPTPEEADAFVNDTRADAYERVVDGLFKSPHYGERWARRWLDLARYSDTNGYEKDRARSIWPYRDWVIKAFNDDKPFDRFTVEQIAGDMLPGATQDQRIATGFHRNTMLNEEGGIDPQEFRYYALVDRVGTTATAWLGLTAACAQCHNHKYDPISQREFYQLMAFFDQADEPTVDVKTPEISARRDEIQKQIKAIESDLANRFPVDGKMEFTPLKPSAVASAGGASTAIGDDGVVMMSGVDPERDTYTVTLETPLADLSAVRVEALVDPSLPSTGPGRTPHGNFVLTEIAVSAAPMDPLEKLQPVKLVRAEADFAQPMYTADQCLDGKPTTGWAIQNPNDPKWNVNRAATFFPEKPFGFVGGTRLVVMLDQQFGTHHTLGKFRILVGRAPADARPIAERRKEFLDAKFNAWVDAESKRAMKWTVLKPGKMQANLPTLSLLPDGSVLASGDQTKLDVYDMEYPLDGAAITAVRLEALPDESLPAGGPGRVSYEGPFGDFFLSDMAVAADGKAVKFSGAVESFASGNNKAINAVDDRTDSGWSISGAQGRESTAVFAAAQPVTGAAALSVKMTFEKYYAAALGRFRVSVTSDPRPIAVGARADVEAILATAAQRRSEADRATLFQYFLSVAPQLAGERAAMENLRKQVPAYPTTLAMKQRPPEQYRQTRIHHRGEFLVTKDEVAPDGLSVLNPLPKEAKRDRLALASWLVDPANPLTARVAMNRQWAAFFGRGIVRTTEDFGTQGEPPTDQPLLDWLAREFIDQKWSLKAMNRMIVTSATYRQSSRATPEMLEKDAVNRVLARGPRFRIEAELVRDVALRASGLLSEKVGGPSVYPPQPAGVTDVAYGAAAWNVSGGEDRYRRGLYTYSKRTAPYAMFGLFDGPSGESCIPRRNVSNTPLQALTMLNDATFIEAAQAMAKHAVEMKDATAEQRATYLFRRCLTRPPSADELAALTGFYAQQKARLEKKELNAEQVGGAGAEAERAAWAATARAILNLDATITKE